jgi:hypothetical protein
MPIYAIPVTQYVACCDSCHKCSEYFSSTTILEQVLLEDGWVRVYSGPVGDDAAWYCPVCIAEQKGE